jgi:hypothetical protein
VFPLEALEPGVGLLEPLDLSDLELDDGMPVELLLRRRQHEILLGGPERE